MNELEKTKALTNAQNRIVVEGAIVRDEPSKSLLKAHLVLSNGLYWIDRKKSDPVFTTTTTDYRYPERLLVDLYVSGQIHWADCLATVIINQGDSPENFSTLIAVLNPEVLDGETGLLKIYVRKPDGTPMTREEHPLSMSVFIQNRVVFEPFF